MRAVFFDLGKVILSFSHENIIERLLSRADPAERRTSELFEYLFDADAGLCNLYDEGGISSQGFFESIDTRFGLGVDFEGFTALWNGIFTEQTEVSALVREVRRHRPVYLLSNVNELHWEYAIKRYDVLAEMDGHVLSFRVGAKKPRPEIYRAAMEAAGVGPGESVFIDDLAENVSAARDCGIAGITYQAPDVLRRALSALGLAG